MNALKGWVGYLLLAASIFVTYQGYRNARNEPLTEEMARDVACAGNRACKLAGARPHTVRTDFFGRTYVWGTGGDSVEVACRRVFVFLGAWKCRAKAPD